MSLLNPTRLAWLRFLQVSLRHLATSTSAMAAATEETLLEYRPLAFYGFARLGSAEEAEAVRTGLKETWEALGALGRVYVSQEGVNGQMVVPEERLEEFSERTMGRLVEGFRAGPERFIVNVEPRTMRVPPSALTTPRRKHERGPLPFRKLDVRLREELVASHGACAGVDLALTHGTRLSPEQWHAQLPAIAASPDDYILLDVRNDYEAAIGRFDNATTPPVNTFRGTFPYLDRLIEERGGIRCEVVSSYLAQKQGFDKVYKLDKGITGYVDWALERGERSLFKGHEYMFDDRLSVKVTDDPLGQCRLCGGPSNTHINCNNVACHVLFIACASCSQRLHGCCSQHCRDGLRIDPDTEPELFRQYCKEAGRVLHREVEATGLQRQFCSLAPEVVHKYLSALDSKEDDKSSSPRFAGSSSSASSASSSS